MGCFRDAGCPSAQRLKVVLAANSPDMTVKQCVNLALNAGWPYAGLAPGVTPGTNSCFAGDSLPTTVVNPGCLAACAGNSSERCGDADCQVSIYSGGGKLCKAAQPGNARGAACMTWGEYCSLSVGHAWHPAVNSVKGALELQSQLQCFSCVHRQHTTIMVTSASPNKALCTSGILTVQCCVCGCTRSQQAALAT